MSGDFAAPSPDIARIRIVSYGGGVQSTALLVLAAQRRIDFSTFVMANVGDDSEHPDTLTYVRDIEDTINGKRTDSYPVWLSPAMVPLREAVSDDAVLFDEDGSCDSGWCFT